MDARIELRKELARAKQRSRHCSIGLEGLLDLWDHRLDGQRATEEVQYRLHGAPLSTGVRPAQTRWGLDQANARMAWDGVLEGRD